MTFLNKKIILKINKQINSEAWKAYMYVYKQYTVNPYYNAT